MTIIPFEPRVVRGLYRPAADSHKGQNGKLLVIGGSKLFHAAIFWSAEVASKIVDLVHFTSPAMENNELMRVKAKEKMWSGIVVPFEELEKYIEEDDCILIGPGMPRKEGLMEGERETKKVVDNLLKKYPEKKWVVDGGALQECEPSLLNRNMIITPHAGEFARLAGKIHDSQFKIQEWENIDERGEMVVSLSQHLHGVTILSKGKVDLVCRGDEVVEVAGGSAGMTKGGTGDVLAGLAAALYCKNEAFMAAQVASYVNKKAGERLAGRVGVYFSAGDLAAEAPKQLVKLVDDFN